MPHPTQLRLAIGVTGIALCLLYFGGAAGGIGTGDRDVVFTPAVDPRVQLTAPLAGVPLAAPATPSSLVARASLAVALGRRSAIRDFAAISTAAAAVAFAGMLHAAGLPPLVAVIAMLGIGVGGTFWWRGVTYTADALFPLLVLLALWAALRWQATRRRAMAVVAAACTVLAIVDFVRPMAGGLLRTPSTPGFMASLTGEFTPLGLFLAVAGLIVLLRSRTTRLPAAIAAVVLLLWHAAWRSTLDPVNVLGVIGGWFAIAIGLSWLHSIVPQRARAFVIAAVALLLIATPLLARWRLSSLGKDAASEQRARLAFDFPVKDVLDGTMMVAESTRADAAIQLSSRLASRPLTMLPQSVEEVAVAMRSGRPIVAFAGAGANLEQHGFLFEPAQFGAVAAATVAGRVPCAPLGDTWTDVSLLVSNGSLVIHGEQPGGPAGLLMRMAANTPIRVAAVEPRGVDVEIGGATRDAAGVPELVEISRGADPTIISSVRIPASGRGGPVALTFGSPIAYAVARSEASAGTSICPGVQRSAVMLGSTASAATAVPMNDNAPFGAGWHPFEADPDFFRWTGAADASLRISSARPSTVQVTITATPAARPAQQPGIGVTVNACRLDTRPMHAGQGDYEWTVGEECWRPGVNQLWIHTAPLISPASLFATHDTRLLGARIGAIRFQRR